MNENDAEAFFTIAKNWGKKSSGNKMGKSIVIKSHNGIPHSNANE